VITSAVRRGRLPTAPNVGHLIVGSMLETQLCNDKAWWTVRGVLIRHNTTRNISVSTTNFVDK